MKPHRRSPSRSPSSTPHSLDGPRVAPAAGRLAGVTRTVAFAVIASVLGALAAGCHRTATTDGSSTGSTSPAPTEASLAPSSSASSSAEGEDEACRARIAEAKSAKPAPGAPAYEAARIGILGRVKGQPLLWLRAPEEAADDTLTAPQRRLREQLRREPPGVRIAHLHQRTKNDRASRRALALREGYLFADNAPDAAALVRSFTVGDFYDTPELWLERGTETHRLARVVQKRGHVAYVHRGGPLDGQEADLYLGDRLRENPSSGAAAWPPAPLHRALLGLADEVGFDRATVAHRAEATGEVVFSARFGSDDVVGQVLTRSEGAALRPVCVSYASPAQRAKAEAFVVATAPQRAAVKALSASIDEGVRDALRFDRPQQEETVDHDGELRPVWQSAYLRGQTSYTYMDNTYPVFLPDGRPAPPEVCAEFVLDTYERAAGTWWAPRGQRPARLAGTLDFNQEGVKNRRGVIALAGYASTHPELFSFTAVDPKDKIPFGDHDRYFADLVARAEQFGSGGIVAIQGRKKDGNIHQHAIFVERTDPLSGFPYGLADQMKRPRRRTWDGIMAEAPLRGLFWIARPTPTLLKKISGEIRAEVASP
jgi:hypothetical protein